MLRSSPSGASWITTARAPWSVAACLPVPPAEIALSFAVARLLSIPRPLAERGGRWGQRGREGSLLRGLCPALACSSCQRAVALRASHERPGRVGFRLGVTSSQRTYSSRPLTSFEVAVRRPPALPSTVLATWRDSAVRRGASRCRGPRLIPLVEVVLIDRQPRGFFGSGPIQYGSRLVGGCQ